MYVCTLHALSLINTPLVVPGALICSWYYTGYILCAQTQLPYLSSIEYVADYTTFVLL